MGKAHMNRLFLAFASAIVMSALSAHGADPPQAPVMMEEMTRQKYVTPSKRERQRC